MENEMNNRFKEIRLALGISQKKLGEALGLTNSGISNIENGQRSVTDKHIKLLTATFNINENWIRTGEGVMFHEIADTYIDHLVKEHHLDKVDKQILESYLELEPSQRQVIKEYILRIAASLTVGTEVPSTVEAPPVDKLLGVEEKPESEAIPVPNAEKEEMVRVFRAARSNDHTEGQWIEIPKSRMDKIKNAKPAEDF